MMTIFEFNAVPLDEVKRDNDRPGLRARRVEAMGAQ